VLTWETLDPSAVERAVSGLIIRDTGGYAAPVNGAGGDQAQDLRQVHRDGSVTIFEVKSFSGRLTTGQKRQINDSYQRAVRLHGPRTWVLVLPHDHTPAELTWFNSLRPVGKRRPPRKVWRGRTWLDVLMAQYPDWERYVQGPDAQLLARAAEHRMEDSALGTSTDYFTRQAALRRRGDELSPYWRWRTVEERDGTVTHVLDARMADSDRLDPITIRTTVTLPGGSAGNLLATSLQRALAYGGTVEIPGQYVDGFEVETSSDATARLLDTGRRSQPVRLTMESVPDTSGLPLPATLSAEMPDGTSAEVDITMFERVGGDRGVTLRGRDHSGVLGVELVHPYSEDDAADRVMTVTSVFAETYAHQAVACLRWMALCEAGAALKVSAGPIVLATAEASSATDDDTNARRYRYAAALQAIGQHVNRLFRLPEEVSHEQAGSVVRAGHALLGGRAPLPSTGIEFALEEHQREEALNFPDESQILTALDWTVEIAGEEIQVGGLAAYGAPVSLANREDVMSGGSTAVFACREGESLCLVKMPEEMPEGWTSH